MSRRRLSFLTLLLSAVLVGQALAAVDHIHFSLSEEVECVACKASHNDDLAVASLSPVSIDVFLFGLAQVNETARSISPSNTRARSPPA